MYWLKKFLFSLIPVVVLGVLGYVFDAIINGPNLFDGHNQNIIFTGVTCGLVIAATYMNDEEMHIVFGIICWILFIAFSVLAFLGPMSFTNSFDFAHLDPLLLHLRVGLIFGWTFLVCYCLAANLTAFGEEYPLIFKIIIPIVVFALATFGGGYLKLIGENALNKLNYVFLFAPLGIIIVLIIILFKAGVVEVGYSGLERRSSRPSSYSGSSHSSSSSSNSSSGSLNTVAVKNALRGLSGSGYSGCTVTLTITDVRVTSGSLNYDIRESIQHASDGSEDYDLAKYLAKEDLNRKINDRLSSFGLKLN